MTTPKRVRGPVSLGAALATFVVLAALAVFLVSGASVAGASSAAPPLLAADTPTPTVTPIDLRTCQVGGRQADYGQFQSGITITPLEQHDVGGYNEWSNTWQVSGPAGQAVTANVVTYRCIGMKRTPDWDHCTAETATGTITSTASVTIPRKA